MGEWSVKHVVCHLQVEVKGRVNLDKLTAFLEELRVSKSRTVSLGTLMCARDASAADKTHLVEVRCACAALGPKFMNLCSLLLLCECCFWVTNGLAILLRMHHLFAMLCALLCITNMCHDAPLFTVLRPRA